MKIDWVRHLVVKPTLGVWRSKNPGMPAQQKNIEDFRKSNNVASYWLGSIVPDQSYDMVTLLFTEEKFITIEDIDNMLLQSKSKSHRFLHLSVNKFLVNTSVDRNEHTNVNDLDERLISHWNDVVGVDPVFVEYHSNDKGYMGNWIYPVTNVIWQTHE